MIPLSEGEHVRVTAGVEERDLERALTDPTGLPNELVQTRFGDRPIAVLVGINSVGRARRLSVEKHAEAQGPIARRGAHHEVQVARMEMMRDPPGGPVEHGGLRSDRPITAERPVVES